MDEYHFDICEEGTCLIATFTGQITTNNYTEFRYDYNEICRRLNLMNHKFIVMDLTHTTFFSSLFVGIAVKLSVKVRNDGGKMALCGLSPQLSELMKKLLLLERESDVEKGLKHFATRAEAIDAMNASDA